MIKSWDTKTHPEVTCAFLMLASPDTVHEHLREYGAFLDDDILLTSRSDEKLETALLSRNEPLINLALARFGADDFVLAELYRRHFMCAPTSPACALDAFLPRSRTCKAQYLPLRVCARRNSSSFGNWQQKLARTGTLRARLF